MKRILSLALALVGATLAMAQDCSAPANQSAPSRGFTIPAGSSTFARFAPTASQSQVRPTNLTELTAAEKEFQRTGPKLFTMDEALALSAKNGKPVFCWVSTADQRVFADPIAREASRIRGNDTIQAVMTDFTNDALTAKGPRLQVSDSNYGPTAQTKFVAIKDLNKRKLDELLQFSRGGSK